MVDRFGLGDRQRVDIGGWGSKRSDDRDAGDGLLGPSPFIGRKKEFSDLPKRPDERIVVGRDKPSQYGRKQYSKGLGDSYGDLEEDYLYSDDHEDKKFSHSANDGLSADVKQLMNSLGLSKSDMEELSRLPDCELSVNNLMHAIGDLRRKKKANSQSESHDSKSSLSFSFDRSRQNEMEYYDPEEPTDLNDQFSPKRAKSPRHSRVADAFSNFQEKWYEQSQQDKKGSKQPSSAWKKNRDSSNEREQFRRSPHHGKQFRRSPQYEDDVYRDHGRELQRSGPPRRQSPGPSQRRVSPGPQRHVSPGTRRQSPLTRRRSLEPPRRQLSPGPARKRPSRFDDDYEPRLKERERDAGLLGNPLNPNARQLEKLAATMKMRNADAREREMLPMKRRDDFIPVERSFSRSVEHTFQKPPLMQDRDEPMRSFDPKKDMRSMTEPRPRRPRDDGLDDDFIPPKRRSFQPQKANASFAPAIVPIAPIVDVQSQALLQAQMQAMQVLKSEHQMGARGGKGDTPSNAKHFTKSEAMEQAKEMRKAHGRVIYLRFKSPIINEEDIVNLAEPFGRVTNILMVKPTQGKKWMQAFLELESSDCAAAMVEHFMPNPPRIRGAYLQVQRSKFATLKLRADQMGRDLSELKNPQRPNRRRFSISPLRENLKSNKKPERDSEDRHSRRSASPREEKTSNDKNVENKDMKKENSKELAKKPTAHECVLLALHDSQKLKQSVTESDSVKLVNGIIQSLEDALSQMKG